MHIDFKDIGDPLDCLVEECAEVIKAVMKIKRFGFQNWNPFTDEHNIDRLLNEMKDVETRIKGVREYINLHYMRSDEYKNGAWILKGKSSDRVRFDDELKS